MESNSTSWANGTFPYGPFGNGTVPFFGSSHGGFLTWLEMMAAHLNFQRSTLALLLWVVYEFLITTDDSVELFWKHGWDMLKGLFLANRWVTTLTLALIVLQVLWESAPDEYCRTAPWFQLVGSAILLIILDISLITRVYNVWSKSLNILIVLVFGSSINIGTYVIMLSRDHSRGGDDIIDPETQAPFPFSSLNSSFPPFASFSGSFSSPFPSPTESGTITSPPFPFPSLRPGSMPPLSNTSSSTGPVGSTFGDHNGTQFPFPFPASGASSAFRYQQCMNAPAFSQTWAVQLTSILFEFMCVALLLYRTLKPLPPVVGRVQRHSSIATSPLTATPGLQTPKFPFPRAITRAARSPYPFARTITRPPRSPYPPSIPLNTPRSPTTPQTIRSHSNSQSKHQWDWSDIWYQMRTNGLLYYICILLAQIVAIIPMFDPFWGLIGIEMNGIFTALAVSGVVLNRLFIHLRQHQPFQYISMDSSSMLEGGDDEDPTTRDSGFYLRRDGLTPSAPTTPNIANALDEGRGLEYHRPRSYEDERDRDIEGKGSTIGLDDYTNENEGGIALEDTGPFAYNSGYGRSVLDSGSFVFGDDHKSGHGSGEGGLRISRVGKYV